MHLGAVVLILRRRHGRPIWRVALRWARAISIAAWWTGWEVVCGLAICSRWTGWWGIISRGLWIVAWRACRWWIVSWRAGRRRIVSRRACRRWVVSLGGKSAWRSGGWCIISRRGRVTAGHGLAGISAPHVLLILAGMCISRYRGRRSAEASGHRARLAARRKMLGLRWCLTIGRWPGIRGIISGIGVTFDPSCSQMSFRPHCHE